MKNFAIVSRILVSLVAYFIAARLLYEHYALASDERRPSSGAAKCIKRLLRAYPRHQDRDREGAPWPTRQSTAVPLT